MFSLPTVRAMNAEMEIWRKVRSRRVEVQFDKPLDDSHGCIVFSQVVVERNFGRAAVRFNNRDRRARIPGDNPVG